MLKTIFLRLSAPARLGVGAVLGLVLLSSAQASETYTATAEVLRQGGGVESSAPVTLSIERFSTDAERDQVMAAITKGGTTAVRDLLAGRPAIGSLRIGDSTTPIKYAYARGSAGGQLITAVASAPIAFPGVRASASAGSDVGLVFVDSGQQKGELIPATKVRLDEQGALVTEASSGLRVRLMKVAKQ
jgi:hypothetical protein